jgi:hypothetical protein
MTDRELMQMALDALEKHVLEYETIEALRARLAQEPLTFEASNVTGIYTTQPYVAQAAMVASQTQGRMRIDPVTGDVGIGNPNQVTLDTSGATGFSLTPIDWGKNT